MTQPALKIRVILVPKTTKPTNSLPLYRHSGPKTAIYSVQSERKLNLFRINIHSRVLFATVFPVDFGAVQAEDKIRMEGVDWARLAKIVSERIDQIMVNTVSTIISISEMRTPKKLATTPALRIVSRKCPIIDTSIKQGSAK